jgi:hypothetical protein
MKMTQMNGEKLAREIVTVFICLLSGTSVRTQGFSLARQVLYSLSYTSSSFCPGCFGDTISSLDKFYTFHFAGMTGMYHQAELFL